MNIFRILFLVVVVIAVAAVTLRVIVRNPVPILLGTNTLYYGYISDGEKFGVRIGETRSNAQVFLENKSFRYLGKINCSHNLKRLINCTEEQENDLYRVKEPLRHGFLYLEFKDDRIIAIIWSFRVLPNVDF